MPELIGYIKGPVSETKGLLRRREATVYLTSPQLYLEGNPIPVRNFGIRRYEFDQKPSKTELETQIRQDLRKALGTGIELGSVIIPAETVKISLEYEDG